MSTSLRSALIVGAGEFGASTAVSLLKAGGYSIRILDRATSLPAPDAESCDINKIVRFDYDDLDYCQLARQAMDEWNKDEWKRFYHNTGCVVRGAIGPGYAMENVMASFRNAQAQEPNVRLLSTPSEISAQLSPSSSVPLTPPHTDERAYFNPVGGWVHASAAMNHLYETIQELGGDIHLAAEMETLITNEQGVVLGVRCKDGREFTADQTILAFGSWMGAHRSLKGLLPEGLVTATGQVVAGIQLSKEDAKRYSDIPIIMQFNESGFYMFPPNQDGLIKFARDAPGYLSDSGVPRTSTDPSAVTYSERNQVGWIPSESVKELRKQLSMNYPQLAQRPIAFTRMCWYADVIGGDFVIDFSPTQPSLLLATGGSGHAFKFLPIMGDLIRSRLEGTLPAHLVHKWRLRPSGDTASHKVSHARRPLDLGALATNAELSFEEQ